MNSTELFAKCHTDKGYFGYFRARDDCYFSRPVLGPDPGTTTNFDGMECVQWSINNYLGLASRGDCAKRPLRPR